MPERARFLELLPFYVNGTLPEADRAWVEDYVKRHADSAADLAFARRLRDYYKQPLADNGAEAGLARLLDRLRQMRAPAEPKAPFWLRWLATPAFAAVAATVVFVQAGVIAYLLPGSAPEQAAWRSMPARTPPGTQLKVMFRPAADLGDILVLLRGLEARIVAGPGPAGELWIEVPRGKPVADAVAALRKSHLVDDVTNPAP
jgi:hypothetical protein